VLRTLALRGGGVKAIVQLLERADVGTLAATLLPGASAPAGVGDSAGPTDASSPSCSPRPSSPV